MVSNMTYTRNMAMKVEECYVSTSLFYGLEENAVTSILGRFGGHN